MGLDTEADRRTKAIKLRLEAWPLVADGDEARRAAAHLRLLFPQGLRLTQVSFAEQDTELRRMVTEMKDPTLAASLDELVGPTFIKAFKKTAKAYGDMLKAMGRAVETGVDQRSVLRAMQIAIVQHASRVLGELDDGDAKSVERVRLLLAPIDNARARTSGGGAAGAASAGAGESGEPPALS